MNILFVNYGDFTTNSLNHIGGFADELVRRGHSCVVAVPHGKETVSQQTEPLYIAADYEELLTNPALFPDRKPADILHAWTPRENVREFAFAYLNRCPARLYVHLEDNEVFLMEAYSCHSVEELRKKTALELDDLLHPSLSHPGRHRLFLEAASGVTVITEKLAELVPDTVPTHLLRPGVDFSFFKPLNPPPKTFREFGLTPDETTVVFPGSTTFANHAEVRNLYVAVKMLNEAGVPCRLVRTGFDCREFRDQLFFDSSGFVVELGYIQRSRLPRLLSLASVLVQPGRPGPFNDYRLPSKVPEFLAVGKPVIMPRCNIGRFLKEEEEVLFLDTGTPDEIAAQCRRLLQNRSLADRVARGAVDFARRHFDLAANATGLIRFYESGGTADRTLLQRWLFTEQVPPALLALRRLEADAPPPQTGVESEKSRWRSFSTALRQAEKAVREMGDQVSHLKKQSQSLEHRLADEQKTLRRLGSTLDESQNVIKELTGLNRRLENEKNAESLNNRFLQDQLEQLKNRLVRMESSVSWKATRPLRFLRRHTFDRVMRYVGAKPPLPPQSSATGSDFICSIEHPQNWNQLSGNLNIRGWCFSRDDEPTFGIRARLAGKRYAASYGQNRIDVKAAHPMQKTSLESGFHVSLPLPRGDHNLVLEWRGKSPQWIPFFERKIHRPFFSDNIDADDYMHWLKQYYPFGRRERRSCRKHLESLPLKPRISVVMPVYNTPPAFLEAAVRSVKDQVYSNWELCIADDASTEPRVRKLLQKFSRRDKRIKVKYRNENGHISAASNDALGLASGEFVAFLDHDDELHPLALYAAIAEINRYPDTALIYTDEDKIDETGAYTEPHFKSDWNPDLLLGQNYVCHLAIYRRSLVMETGGFREGTEGCQDWDLALRITRRIDSRQIRHIPLPLYHWRASAGSTALLADEKDYAKTAARKVLADHIESSNLSAEIIPVPGGHWRIKYPPPPVRPLVSIIIPTRNHSGILRNCIDSVRQKTTWPHYEILVVDNDSDDEATQRYFDELRGDGIEVLSCPGPFNHSAINNFAVRESSGEILCFLNNDVEVITPGWLDEMAVQAHREEIGAVGAMLYYPNDTIQHAGVVLGICGIAGHAFKNFNRGEDGLFNRLRLVQNYSAVTAACLAVRRQVFDEVGGFEEEKLPVAFNDIDLCLKIRRAGYRNLWTPFAELYHHESVSRGAEDTVEKHNRFMTETDTMQRRWVSILDRDPAYNPNLTLKDDDFSLARPPRTRRYWNPGSL